MPPTRKPMGSAPRKPTTFRGENRPSSATLRMTLGPDDAFAKLASQLLEAADKVECDQDDYVTGLRYILGEVEVALQAAKETM